MVNRKTIYSKVVKTKDDLDDAITSASGVITGDLSSLSIDVSSIGSDVDTIDVNVDTINTNVGSNTDDYTDSTVFGGLNENNSYFHTSSFIYPTGTSSVSLTDGSYVEVIPASTITNPFRIIGVMIGEIDTTDGWYQFMIAKGASSSEVDIASTAEYRKASYEVRGEYKPVTSSIQAANTRISVKLTGAGGTTDIKLAYQEYT